MSTLPSHGAVKLPLGLRDEFTFALLEDFRIPGLTKADCRVLFHFYDADGGGSVSVDEFIAAIEATSAL